MTYCVRFLVNGSLSLLHSVILPIHTLLFPTHPTLSFPDISAVLLFLSFLALTWPVLISLNLTCCCYRVGLHPSTGRPVMAIWKLCLYFWRGVPTLKQRTRYNISHTFTPLRCPLSIVHNCLPSRHDLTNLLLASSVPIHTSPYL